MKQLLILTLTLASLEAQASIFDDVKGWFGGSDEQTEKPAEPKAAPTPAAATEAASQQAGTMTSLLPLVTSTLGVTEKQARGGLGAVFQASKSIMTSEDFSLIERYVPEVNQLMREAPATNQLMGGALRMAGVGAGGTAAANLATQFNDLGLGTDMILKYSGLAGDYLKNSSPDLAGRFTDAITGLL
ncbi:MAG: DUF2780 domain-containing protein [Pseudomonadales bacterium]|nr:DUF2780 domain-containing protein [Pseudomonadales bacterium]MBO6596880.1 DUF2780 domain-containing protein [Pseudomonadales bacterium]MBO6823131.1 DUF2780 domain-containing protein [Pseudomonadales bacterium]